MFEFDDVYVMAGRCQGTPDDIVAVFDSDTSGVIKAWYFPHKLIREINSLFPEDMTVDPARIFAEILGRVANGAEIETGWILEKRIDQPVPRPRRVTS